MIGHKWEPAEGTIISSQPDPARRPDKDGMPQSAAYDIDVRMPDSSRLRAQVASGHHRSLQPGTIVRLEVNAKTGEVRLHPQHSQLIVGFDTSATNMRDDSAAGGDFPAAPGVTTTFRMGGADVDLTQFFSDGFADVGQVSVVSGSEALDLVRTIMSGDPSARAAARDQFRQLAGSQGQFQGQQGQGQQGQAHSPSDRLAKLQEMADRGQITQDEFATKRQQILDEI